MSNIIKVVVLALIALILNLIVNKQNKDIGLVLSIATCCLILASAASYLEQIIVFLRNIQALGNLNPEFMAILLKVTGIGLLCEISSLICTDAGNSSLGKAIQIFSVVTIIYLSLPLLSAMIELVNSILGDI